MFNNIFAENAPKYWERGLAVIPLKRKDKMPVMANWQKYAHELPSADEQTYWPLTYKDCNIGLPCGPQSNIMVIDYDYNDERVEKAILSVIPHSPWKRVGQKGFIMAYRYNGTPTRNIFDVGGKCIVQILSVGAQFVLPPSIHPKTMQPYVANCELLDVLNQLPILPADTEDKLRAALAQVVQLADKGVGKSRIKFLEKVPSGSRDVRMNQTAGTIAQSILRGEVSVKEGLNVMQGWFDMNVEKLDNDQIDVNKGKGQIIQYVVRGIKKQSRMLPPGWDEGLSEEDKKLWGLDFGDEHQEWLAEDIVKYIHKTYADYPKEDPAVTQMETFVLTKLARSKNINALDEGKIIKALQNSGRANASDYKRMLKQLRAGDIEGISHQEIAEELIKELEIKYGKLAFWNDLIWWWEGSRWEELSDQRVRHVIQSDFGNLEMAKRFSDHKGILAVMKDQIPQTIKPSDDINGINFANGFLNSDGKLMAHAPEFGMTYTLPFNYVPELAGKCPNFMRYLHDSWGDDPDYEEKKMALQEAISATLFGVAPKYQHCFLLYGVPNSGKSVLMEIISSMVPDEAYCAIPPEVWGERFIPAQFVGKLLNIAGELHETRRIDSKAFKQIVVGESITGENKGKDPFHFKPNAAHWFAGNHLPRTLDTSDGFTRRWMIFRFTKAVEKGKVDRSLAMRIISEEMEAVVAWAIEGWSRLKGKDDYTMSLSNIEELEQMALQNSSVRQWMKQRLIEKEGNRVKEADMFRDYFSFCVMTGNKPATAKTFNTELKMFKAEARQPEGIYEDGQIIHMNVAIKAGAVNA